VKPVFSISKQVNHNHKKSKSLKDLSFFSVFFFPLKKHRMFSFGSTTNTSSPQTSTSFGGFGSTSSFAPELTADAAELVKLSMSESVKNDADMATRIGQAFQRIISSDDGIQSCIDAKAPLALSTLLQENVVKENVIAEKSVLEALRNLSSSDAGRQACLESGVSHSLIDWASKKSSNENDIIWIQGTGAGSRGSVLVNLAQTGYTQEAHQIISLSRIASLIGRDSDGGLPELWDVMGKRKR
jgi:hypothetical protein